MGSVIDIYERHCLPHLINAVCGMGAIRQQRERVVPLATGRVLEIGMGSGLNLPYYDPEKVEQLWGLEPSAPLREMAMRNLSTSPIALRWLDAPAEAIPLEHHSVDTVVLTYTLCTIPDWQTALGEMRRVLKPGGLLLFCEHGTAPDRWVRGIQEGLNPVWKTFSGGCQLNRPIPALIEASGFRIQSLTTEYLPGSFKFAGYNYRGIARTKKDK